jgi:hypothetical protein
MAATAATAEMQVGTPEHVLATAQSMLGQAAERKLAPDLRSFMRSRRKEIATEVAGIIY